MTILAPGEEQHLALPRDMVQAWRNVLGQVAPSSQPQYEASAATFNAWLHEHQMTLRTVDRSAMIAYHEHLAARYAKATAARKWSVACQLLRDDYPAANLRGFRVDDASPHIALSRDQVRELLEKIDLATLKGRRDHALLLLLIRTGIRRAECAALALSDFHHEQGHTTMTVRHGKGDKRRKVKVPVDVAREIEAYVEALRTAHAAALERELAELERATDLDEETRQARRQKSYERHTLTVGDPLFVGFEKGDHPTRERLSTKTIERVVAAAGQALKVERLTPHDLRTTFNTLAKKGGATLEQRQYTMGHTRPETTQRYDRDSDNLDDSAALCYAGKNWQIEV